VPAFETLQGEALQAHAAMMRIAARQCEVVQ
jgi:hypothetical protein